MGKVVLQKRKNFNFIISKKRELFSDDQTNPVTNLWERVFALKRTTRIYNSTWNQKKVHGYLDWKSLLGTVLIGMFSEKFWNFNKVPNNFVTF